MGKDAARVDVAVFSSGWFLPEVGPRPTVPWVMVHAVKVATNGKFVKAKITR